jgi:hypothetical protein
MLASSLCPGHRDSESLGAGARSELLPRGCSRSLSVDSNSLSGELGGGHLGALGLASATRGECERSSGEGWKRSREAELSGWTGEYDPRDDGDGAV